MAGVARVVTIKKFTYRGNTNERWENEYAFTGGPAADAAAWRTLFDALVAQEKTLYPAAVSVVGGYAYDDDAIDALSVWSVDLTVSPETPVLGTMTATGCTPGPGDTAAWVRWKTSRRTTNGKPIYLRKYFHPAQLGVAGPDAICTNWATPAAAFGAKMHDGSFAGGRTIRSRQFSDIILSHGVSQYPTTRTLKRRGKRH